MRDEVISPGFPPSLVHLSSMLTHERKVAQQSFRGDVYGRLRAVRESKQSFSQGGVLSYIWHHLTKHDASPLIRPRIRPQQMHSEAGSAHCLDYNFRTKLKAHIFSLFLYVKKLEKLGNFPVTQTIGRQLKSEQRCPTCPGWAPWVPCSTSCLPQLLLNNQISQGVGLTLSTHWRSWSPNSFLVSTLWSHWPMLTETGWGQGRASQLAGDKVVLCQGKFLKDPSA